MKITRLRTQVVDMPFDPPIGVGIATFRSATCVLVFLETDQGVVGEGLVFTFNRQRIKVLDEMVRSFEPLVVGLDPEMSGSFNLRAWADLRNYGWAGISVQGLAGIDGALWDLRGKLAGRNSACLVGACRKTVPLYHSSELWVTKSIDELQRIAAAQAKQGFRAMKMRLIGDHRKDPARVRALREAIGPDVDLMADANQKMTVGDAIRLGRMLEEYNLTWFEEPVVAHDHAGEAAVAAALDTPIASGESVYTSRAVVEMLERRSVDVLMPDVLRMGGPTEFLKAATLAEGFNVPVSPHTYPEMSISLLAAIPNASFLEYMPWLSPIYREQIEIDDKGQAVVPDRPGWGFSFDPAAIAKFSVA